MPSVACLAVGYGTKRIGEAMHLKTSIGSVRPLLLFFAVQPFTCAYCSIVRLFFVFCFADEGD